MSEADHDPRVYFAAERTLLAWVRTGLTLMGFGFVVARFGLFLAMLRQAEPRSHLFSVVIGVSLVLLGVATLAVAALQHKRFIASLTMAQLPHGVTIGMPLLLAWTMCLIGLMLAAYLSW